MRQMERLLQVGGQSEGWTELVFCIMDWKVTGGGDLSIVWIFKRKPSLVGMVTLLSSKVIPSLMQAANSEHLLPEVMATREMVLGKEFTGTLSCSETLVFGEILGRGREIIWVPSSEQEEKDEIGACRAVRSLCPQS